VGQIKVAHRISLADSFAVALAQVEGAELVTSDHREFDPLAEAGVCKFRFIR
jgi:predicted nucleic acid-binding protein